MPTEVLRAAALAEAERRHGSGLVVVVSTAMPPGRLALAARTLGDLARSERPDVAVTVVDLATVGGNGQC